VPSRAGLTVRLGNDALLRELNQRFLGEDEATDVLSFPGDLTDHVSSVSVRRADRRVGDVAISVEQAMRQGANPAAELRLLAVHGLLHCLGHDHGEPAGAAQMTALTRLLLPDQTVPEL
jgi:probable rRNA maturation factor